MSIAIPVLVAGLAILLAVVLRSPHHSIYDEIYFLPYVSGLKADGLSAKFLSSLPGAPGPLYGILHLALEPLTRLDGPRMRLVNVVLLVALMAVLGAYLRFQKHPQFVLSSLLALAVPMTWVVAGLALTEMPSMFLATLSLVSMLVGLHNVTDTKSVWLPFLLSAALLGAACWGRQSYLVLFAMPAIVALRRPNLRAASLAFAILSVALISPLFLVWHGTVSPAQAHVAGWSVTHAIWGASYCGMGIFLLAPQFFLRPTRWWGAGGVSAAILNAMFSTFELYPIRSVAGKLLPSHLLPIYGGICGTLVAGFGLTFFAMLLTFIWQNRGDDEASVIGLGLLFLGVSPLLIGHQYSSRYTAMALPFMVLFSARWQFAGLGGLLLMILGLALGFASLSTYLFS